MVNTGLVGRCGLYCGACEIYRAHKDGGKYRQRVAAFLKCPPEKVRCEGCQVLTPECWGNDCKILQCLNAKGFKFCYECLNYNEHDCENFERFSEAYLKEDGVDLRANLSRIEAGEVEDWQKKSKEKFRCPYCGKPLSFGAFRKKCYHCGRDLHIRT